MSYSITSYADNAPDVTPTTDTEIAQYGERDYRGTPYIYAYHDGGYTPLHHLAKLVEESWTTSEGAVRCNARYVLPTQQEVLRALGTECASLVVIAVYATTRPYSLTLNPDEFVWGLYEIVTDDSDHPNDPVDILGSWWYSVDTAYSYIVSGSSHIPTYVSGGFERVLDSLSGLEDLLDLLKGRDHLLKGETIEHVLALDDRSYHIRVLADHIRAH